MTKQPVAVVAAIVTAVKAVLAALVITKVVHLDAVQVAQLALAVESALAVPAAVFVHNRVSPVPKAPKPLDPRVAAEIRKLFLQFSDEWVAAHTAKPGAPKASSA